MTLADMGLQACDDHCRKQLQLILVQKDMNPSCHSCKQSDRTCAHALHCLEEGYVDAIPRTNDPVEDWLRRIDIDLDLDYCMIEYV